jgi:DNA-binding LacI/PurR family transcriptional regulator
MKTSIRDVAKLAGVSMSTVSNVLTGKKKVSPHLIEKVESAIKTLQYSPNPMASGLRSNSSKMIGVLIPSFNHAFFAQILRGIQDASNKSGYITSVYETNSNILNEEHCLNLLLNSMADGIILASQVGTNPKNNPHYFEIFKDFRESGKSIPVICIDERIDLPFVDSIIVDNRSASYSAVKHLIDKGHSKIAHISGPLSFYNCQERLAGYTDALVESGIKPQPSWIRNGELSPISGYNSMRELLNETDVTAVFAANDQSGIGAIKAIKENGLQVPEDMAVIGFDNIYASTLISPSLSTINVPAYQMGTLAMERILNRITGEITDLNDPIILKTHIIIRKSTDINSNDSWDLHGW